MKRKMIATICTLMTAACLTSLVACGDTANHSWDGAWTYGPDEHWHECTDEDCNTITDLCEHTMVDGQCSVCGYKPHAWDSAWSYGPYEHWHECTDEDCNTITDLGEHTMVDGQCSVCGCPEEN